MPVECFGSFACFFVCIFGLGIPSANSQKKKRASVHVGGKKVVVMLKKKTSASPLTFFDILARPEAWRQQA
jgi:hypothetical protein